MKRKDKFASMCLGFTVAIASVASSFQGHAQSAIATISDTINGGGFNYTIALENTGNTNLNGFWYAWTDSGNNLPSSPNLSNLGNSLGWGETVFGGNSIQWQNSAGTALAPGDSATFTFFSTVTPTAITTAPSGESVVYVNNIQFNQAIAGVSSPVFSPSLASVPEPSAIALLGISSIGVLATRKLVRRTQRSTAQ